MKFWGKQSTELQTEKTLNNFNRFTSFPKPISLKIRIIIHHIVILLANNFWQCNTILQILIRHTFSFNTANFIFNTGQSVQILHTKIIGP